MSELFISCQSADPLAHSFRQQLECWSEQDWEFPTVSFHEQHLPIRFTGFRAAKIKRQLKRDIKRAHRLLVIVSRETWQSEWTDWEIATAIQAGKTVLATKLDSTNIAPLALIAGPSTWIPPFDRSVFTQQRN
ncbi:TIR domain-containing protein [Levilactobacillus huananensis]|uniref:TIR domain-containing protein n=1 Tax=Levilactobacillus huananensis TaxID=2486019 RepID=UPI000F76628E|nr:TIR domain-containing protein [Levilactobacillus huananensis]